MSVSNRVHARIILEDVLGTGTRRLALRSMNNVIDRDGDYFHVESMTEVFNSAKVKSSALWDTYSIWETSDGRLLLGEWEDDCTIYGYELEAGDAIYFYSIDKVAQIQ